jgi:hypothetical protein
MSNHRTIGGLVQNPAVYDAAVLKSETHQLAVPRGWASIKLYN